MRKIGICFAYSERVVPLAEQFLLSLSKNIINKASNECKFEIHAYKCNFFVNRADWNRGTNHNDFKYDPFSFNHDFSRLNINNCKIIMHDFYEGQKGFINYFLPDIAVYQSFADQYIINGNDYEFLMFCHDDLLFEKPVDMINSMIRILDIGQYNVISKISCNCNEDISIRFHPAMIFLKSLTYLNCNLSFINDLDVFNRNEFRVNSDGGSKFLASYYHNNNSFVGNRPFISIPDEWYTHIRGWGDGGVEFSYFNKDTKNIFNDILENAKKNVDLMLYE